MITGAIIMAVGVLIGHLITKESRSDGPNMTVVKNSSPASSDD